MQRRLDDLYVLGRPYTLDDLSGGEPVEVWLQKLDPLDADKTLRKANAAKARLLMTRADEDSDEWLEMYADVASFSDDSLREYLIQEDLAEFADSREAELSAEPEWADEGYLQGLRDAWNGTRDEPGLREREEGDTERDKCLAELKRFTEAVNEHLDSERQNLLSDLADKPIEDLRKRAVKRFIEVRASAVWMTEFRTCEIAYGVRDASNHSRYYFGAKGKETEEVDIVRVRRLPPEVFSALGEAYAELVVPPQEGKDSPAAPSSSQPSGLSGEEETVPPSGPPVAAR
jgi:hypothetical protein